MKQDQETSTAFFSPFWPIFFIALSMIIFLSWQLSIGVRQYLNGARIADQQEALAAQAMQIESNFQALIMDVLELAPQNADIQSIVNNYNIRFTPPAAATDAAPAP
jgi:hypothetical protein